jgi:hypothetical protein
VSRALVPIAGNETTDDDDVNPRSAALPPHAAAPEERSERENHDTGVSSGVLMMWLVIHKLNMKETWESG